MSYLLFALPLVGLLAIFGIALRVPIETASNDSAFSASADMAKGKRNGMEVPLASPWSFR